METDASDGASATPETTAGPKARGPRPPLPTWARRSLVAVSLVVAFGVLAWGIGKGDTDLPQPDSDATVQYQLPAPGSDVLRQATMGAKLAEGWDGRLRINDVAIPEEQMDGAVPRSSLTDAQFEQFGIRPNGKDRVFFTPGPDKVISELDSGTVTIVLTYFQVGREATTARTITWTVSVD